MISPIGEAMRQIVRIVLIAMFLTITFGCGTFIGREYPSLRAVDGSPFYPATLMDAYFIYGGVRQFERERPTSEFPSRTASCFIVPLSILDLPISIATDTILFPVDLIREIKRPPPKSPYITLSPKRPESVELGLRLISVSDNGIVVQELSTGKRKAVKNGEWVVPIGEDGTHQIKFVHFSPKEGSVDFIKEIQVVPQPPVPSIQPIDSTRYRLDPR
jgi:uncharacterized protein YceK